MPTLDIDLFDDAPKVGDKVEVTGKVKSINEDDGKVEVSYDDVSIVGKKHKKRKNYDRNDDYFDETVTVDREMNPNTQSLDQALSQAFPNTQ